MAGIEVQELVTKLGFKTNDAQMNKYKKGIASLKKGALFASAAVVGIGAGIGYLAKKAGEMEQVKIAFETMTGSVTKAKALIEDITKFAANTPFTLTGLVENSKKLLAFGIESDKVVEKMTNLGNIAAGVGRDKLPTLVRAYGKISVKGKATMEELNMILEAGVDILGEMGNNLGKSKDQILDMVRAGKIGFKDVDKALSTLSTGTGKFANLMVKQSKSFLGLMSNLQDYLEITAIQMGEELLPVLKDIATELINWLEINKDLIKQGLLQFMKKLASVLGSIAGLVGKMIKLQAKTGLVTEALRILFQVMLLIKGLQFVRMIQNLALGFQGLGIKSGIASKGIAGVSTALGAVAVIAISLKAIFDAIESLYKGEAVGLMKWAMSLRDIFNDMLDIFPKWFQWLTKLLSPLHQFSNFLNKLGITEFLSKSKIQEMQAGLVQTNTQSIQPTAQSLSGGSTVKNNSISNAPVFNINAAPGMSTKDLARDVAKEWQTDYERNLRFVSSSIGD